MQCKIDVGDFIDAAAKQSLQARIRRFVDRAGTHQTIGPRLLEPLGISSLKDAEIHQLEAVVDLMTKITIYA